MSAIFLDLDGTLTDPKPGITGAVIHALDTLGLDSFTQDQLEWVIGPPLLDSFAKLGAQDPHQALALYRAHYTAGGMYDCTVYDGIHDALATLAAAGHRLFLATAKPIVYATKITAHFGLDPHMEQQFGPELDGTFNDKGDLLRHALGLTGIDPQDAYMVGDRHSDFTAAKVNGITSLGVTWGYGGQDELENADALCSMPRQLASDLARLIG